MLLLSKSIVSTNPTIDQRQMVVRSVNASFEICSFGFTLRLGTNAMSVGIVVLPLETYIRIAESLFSYERAHISEKTSVDIAE